MEWERDETVWTTRRFLALTDKGEEHLEKLVQRDPGSLSRDEGRDAYILWILAQGDYPEDLLLQTYRERFGGRGVSEAQGILRGLLRKGYLEGRYAGRATLGPWSPS